MLPRASSFAALASGAVSPFQPNQRPPVSLSASKTPTASPPAAERPSWGGATRFDTTINLLFNLSNLLGVSHRRAGRQRPLPYSLYWQQRRALPARRCETPVLKSETPNLLRRLPDCRSPSGRYRKKSPHNGPS